MDDKEKKITWETPELIELDLDVDEIKNGNAAITTDATFGSGS